MCFKTSTTITRVFLYIRQLLNNVVALSAVVQGIGISYYLISYISENHIRVGHYYLRQRRLCFWSCWFVCLSTRLYLKSNERLLHETLSEVCLGPRNNLLNLLIIRIMIGISDWLSSYLMYFTFSAPTFGFPVPLGVGDAEVPLGALQELHPERPHPVRISECPHAHLFRYVLPLAHPLDLFLQKNNRKALVKPQFQ